jgi:hypothetical protein
MAAVLAAVQQGLDLGDLGRQGLDLRARDVPVRVDVRLELVGQRRDLRGREQLGAVGLARHRQRRHGGGDRSDVQVVGQPVRGERQGVVRGAGGAAPGRRAGGVAVEAGQDRVEDPGVILGRGPGHVRVRHRPAGGAQAVGAHHLVRAGVGEVVGRLVQIPGSAGARVRGAAHDRRGRAADRVQDALPRHFELAGAVLGGELVDRVERDARGGRGRRHAELARRAGGVDPHGCRGAVVERDHVPIGRVVVVRVLREADRAHRVAPVRRRVERGVQGAVGLALVAVDRHRIGVAGGRHDRFVLAQGLKLHRAGAQVHRRGRGIGRQRVVQRARLESSEARNPNGRHGQAPFLSTTGCAGFTVLLAPALAFFCCLTWIPRIEANTP